MIIGLTGEAGAGKDTVGAELIVRYDFTRLSFADVMRDALLTLDPWLADPTWNRYPEVRLSTLVGWAGWDGAKRHLAWGREVRRLLEHVGDMIKGVAGEGAFVKAIDDKLCALVAEHVDGVDVVITDVRFDNERALIRDVWHGQIVEVVRPDNPLRITSTHPSATNRPRADYRICNDGDLTSLAERVDLTVAAILGRTSR